MTRILCASGNSMREQTCRAPEINSTLGEVVEHYDLVLNPGLFEAEKGDLVEYLKSL